MAGKAGRPRRNPGGPEDVKRNFSIDAETWQAFLEAAISVGYKDRAEAFRDLLVEFVANPRRVFKDARRSADNSSGYESQV